MVAQIPAGEEQVSNAELIRLCALDNRLYGKTFFPKAIRQETPQFHSEIDEALFSNDRFVSIEAFRGSGKTTKTRLYVSKKVAYAISHTILIVGASQDHAIKTVEWLKRNVEFNRKWADTFGLRPGAKWAGSDIEIAHGIDEYPIRVMAVGITGQIRGINVDDYRPDLIVVDDSDNEETTGTEEQRKKTAALFFGALAKSLAPESEAPDAKMVQLQTPLANGDTADIASKDEQWRSLRFSCFDENGESRWPERFSTASLLADKNAHIRRGQLSLWMREMECLIVPDGGLSFVPENLKTYDLTPEGMVFIITIDPASSESKTADEQVAMLFGLWNERIYVIDFSAHKGEMPEELIVTLFQWAREYSILGIWVESIAYQRVLAHLVKQAMRTHRIFIPVHMVQDKRKKADRIIQAVGRASGYGLLYVRTVHTRLIAQYCHYNPNSKEHDDIMDALSMGIDVAHKLNVKDWIEGTSVRIQEYDSGSTRKIISRACP